MRLGLLTAMGDDWRETLEKVRIAEDLGYERVSSAESWTPSPLPWLSLIAANTSKIEIGTSILNCFSRTPAALAQEFATLDQISEGRMVLGLGSSGEFVNYEGEIFQMSRGFKLRVQPYRDHIPVYIAGITPKSIRQTGEVADGIIPIHWPKTRFQTLKEELAEGARAAGRGDVELTIATQTHMQILDGTRDEEQWQAARQPLQYYINRMGVFYWQMLSRNGFEGEVGASRAAWAERDVEGSFAAITDEMVREIEVIGPIESVREQLQERSDLGADIQMLHMPEGTVAEVGATLEGLIR
jgi:alkanesulfonate monooxygenase SsuD/methylene tetrahydromethanopterin reductase-like flavin-dependent oxidoreductase (luciferase family)